MIPEGWVGAVMRDLFGTGRLFMSRSTGEGFWALGRRKCRQVVQVYATRVTRDILANFRRSQGQKHPRAEPTDFPDRH